ncbi:MAG: class I SAM-dependent methyltransferase [Rhodospirillaceae bacterium]|nr:class I SAM-dependent methyltransferase [Rhodospirillaceae bacterium]
MLPIDFVLRRIIAKGTLEVTDHRGRRHVIGDGTDPKVSIRITDKWFATKLALSPSVTIGESYMDGTLKLTNDASIYNFLEILLMNVGGGDYPLINRIFMALDTMFRRLQQFNPARRSKANVAHHYDLSGGLYELFLDPDKQYSCAYFDTPESDLATAQEDKKYHIAAKLLLDKGLRVLDIGSGWGGLGLYLAHQFGACVTGITLSEEQHKISNQRAQENNLQDCAEFRLHDYRTLEGEFDRIVSVGMFEHVGAGHYQAFFDKIRNLLTEDGVALLHTIGRSGPPLSTDAWTRKYIFPGGSMPSLSDTAPAIEKAGLVVTDIEFLGRHYAETLRHWQINFRANRNKVRDIYDERFCRMWEYYLAGAEASFRYLGLTVFQIQLARRQDAVPMTRDYIAETEAKLKNPRSERQRAA